jgi:putative FmdB family regulatory protein
MPIYEYKCTTCDTKQAIVKKADERDKDLPVCRICKMDMKRVYSNIGVAFKGNGFYTTDR